MAAIEPPDDPLEIGADWDLALRVWPDLGRFVTHHTEWLLQAIRGHGPMSLLLSARCLKSKEWDLLDGQRNPNRGK
jgi:hypothetical protein